MPQKHKYYNLILQPLSWIYGFVVFVRNKLFDWGILKETSFPNIPIICVGNLSVGGTGKTPHIEYLIRLLQDKYKVAVVSRGYKRKEKKPLIATNTSTYQQIGDEPYQIKQKYPNTIIAVDANRKRAINHLLKLEPHQRPDIILMDDGFQHRYVKPSFNIILSDNSRPIYEDSLLPLGQLREPTDNLHKANIVVVTKCPPHMKPIDMRIAYNGFNLYPYQSLMFTYMSYGQIISLQGNSLPNKALQEKEVLLITGIAKPAHLLRYIKKICHKVKILKYPDHHNYSHEDIQNINTQLEELNPEKRIAITTEKDMVKLQHTTLPHNLYQSLYYIPIQIAFFSKEEQSIFNKKILNHVRKNTTNRPLHKTSG